MITLDYKIEEWRLKAPFSFAGYRIESLDVLHVRLTRGGASGQGEGVLPVVFPVTLEEMEADVLALRAALDAGGDLEALTAAMQVMPARNAVDCALWDLRAKESGRSIWSLAGLDEGPRAIRVDETIGLGTPQEMADAAARSSHSVLKAKMDGAHIIPRLEAIRRARPDAELIIDANQSWSIPQLIGEVEAMHALGVRMIEQPVPPAQDGDLAGLSLPVPLFADESCHKAADVARLSRSYQGVNIKLDKTGGLSEALALARAARGFGMGVMVGCMSGTSLSMAPAYVIASLSDWADLDGPLQLAADRTPPMRYQSGNLHHYDPALWG